MTSVVPQSSDLELVFFNIIINDIDRGMECTHSKLEDNTKMSDAVNTTQGQERPGQKGPELEKWTMKN